MKGVSLTFYTDEFDKHHGIVTYEWLLEFAKKHHLKGGTAFRAISGFGRHNVLHEEHFFELGSNVPIKINFILSLEEAGKFLELVKEEKLNLFYSISDIEYGTT